MEILVGYRLRSFASPAYYGGQESPVEVPPAAFSINFDTPSGDVDLREGAVLANGYLDTTSATTAAGEQANANISLFRSQMLADDPDEWTYSFTYNFDAADEAGMANATLVSAPVWLLKTLTRLDTVNGLRTITTSSPVFVFDDTDHAVFVTQSTITGVTQIYLDGSLIGAYDANDDVDTIQRLSSNASRMFIGDSGSPTPALFKDMNVWYSVLTQPQIATFSIVPPATGTENIVAQEVLATKSSTLVASGAVWFDLPDLPFLNVPSPPAASLVHDPILHHLDYVGRVVKIVDGVDVYDPLPQWTAPQNMVSQWNDPNTLRSRYTSLCVPEGHHGDYRVDWTVTDTNGDTAILKSEVVTFVDPDVAFAGQKTIAVSSQGFTDAPTGAVQVTPENLAQWLVDNPASNGDLRRLSFRSGETFDLGQEIRFDATTGIVRASIFGGTAMAFIDHAYKSSSIFAITGAGLSDEFSFRGVFFQGGFDSIRQVGLTCTSPVETSGAQRDDFTITYDDCDARGFHNSYLFRGGDAANRRVFINNCAGADNTSSSVYGEYAGDGGRLAIKGCRFDPSSDQVVIGKHPTTNGLKTSSTIGIRWGEVEFIDFVCIDGFTNSGSFGGVGDHTNEQPFLRGDSVGTEGTKNYISRIVLEGGTNSMIMWGASGTRDDLPANWLFESILAISSPFFSYAMLYAERNFQIRNSILISFDYESDIAFAATRSLLATGATSPTDSLLAEPVFALGCTAIFLQSAANDRNRTFLFDAPVTGSTGEFATKHYEDNIFHAPNIDAPITGDGPIDLSNNFPDITPRWTGRRYGFVETVIAATGTVPQNDSFEIAYADLRQSIYGPLGVGETTQFANDIPTDQAYWDDVIANDTGRHQLWVQSVGDAVGEEYMADEGEFSIVTTATGLLITNLQTIEWDLSLLAIMFDRLSKLPAGDTSKANPADVPMPGISGEPTAAQMRAGTYPNYRDFFGNLRSTSRKGAIDSLPV